MGKVLSFDILAGSTENTKMFNGYCDSYPEIIDMNIYFDSVDYIKCIESIYIAENLETLKDIELLRVLTIFSYEFDNEYHALFDGYYNELYGYAQSYSPEETLQDLLMNIMNTEASNIYGSKYINENMIQQIQGLINILKEQYIKIIGEFNWISARTKEKAKEKISSIKPFIAFSDTGDNSLYVYIKDAKNTAELILRIQEKKHMDIQKRIKSPLVFDPWIYTPSYAINPTYISEINAMIIPGGLLQYPIYLDNGEEDDNLYTLGFVITHEMCHALDSISSTNSEAGLVNNIWLDEERDYYLGLIHRIGELISKDTFLNENDIIGYRFSNETVADITSLNCVLEIYKERNSEEDLSTVFFKWANLWKLKAFSDWIKYNLNTGKHDPFYLRANFVVAQFDDFYKCYKIDKKDKMYIPERDRSIVW